MTHDKRFQAVIFDLDGTLLDTLRDIAEAMNRALAHLDLPPHEIEAYRQFVGEGATVLAQKVLPEGHRTDAMTKRLRDLFIKDYRSNWNIYTRPYPGIRELLDELVKARIPMAVLSNKPHYFTVVCVETFLDRWPFTIVLGESETCPKKPSPAGALRIAHELNLHPRDFLFVGDTRIDMITANRAGMYPCGVLWGFRGKEELFASGAKSMVEHPLEIIDLMSFQGDK